MPFVFGDTFELVGGELNLSVAMATYWTNMASSGDPNIWKGPRSGAGYALQQEQQEQEQEQQEQQQQQQRRRYTAWAAASPPDLGPEKRPANYTFWWQLSRYECGGSRCVCARARVRVRARARTRV